MSLVAKIAAVMIPTTGTTATGTAPMSPAPSRPRTTNIGVVGVAPGARLWAVKVLDNSGNGLLSDVICGLDWVAANAAANGIKVINMSLGGGANNADQKSCEGHTTPLHDGDL